jgi:hypothetical protein
MKTEQVISLLALGLVPQSRRAIFNRFGIALVVGVVGAVAALMLTHGVQPGLRTHLALPMFWGKLAFPLSMGVAAVAIAARLAIPGAAPGRRWLMLAIPYAVLWAVALVVLATASANVRQDLVLGHTWKQCPFWIALLSVPCYIAFLWAMRGLAPTRLRLTGAAVGVLSGAVGTLVYVLSCPEMSVPFWASWYSVGMAIPAVAGYFLGRFSFRWS